MKIVILCLSPSRGGLELYAFNEIKQLIKRGYECLAVVSPNSYLSEILKREEIPFATLKPSLNKFPLITSIRLKNILANFNATTLHFHWGQDLYLAALAKAMLTTKLALVHSRHMNLTRNKKNIFHKWFYKKIDLLIVGTKLLQNAAQKYLVIPEHMIKLLYIGVRVPVIDNLECGQFFDDVNFKKRKLNLAIFGRIEEGKGQHLVTQAIQRMVADGKDISLTMVGHTMDSTYKNQLKEDIHNIKEFIQFKEFVSNAADCMNCFDVVVLSTHCETFGLVLVEAMRAGVTVIGTNDGGVPEIIKHGETGLLVEPRNSINMQERLEQIYSEPGLRKKLALNGKVYADKVFSDEIHYEQLEHELQTVTNTH